MPVIGECDCCARYPVVLNRCWATGIETYACALCHGYEKDEFDCELLLSDRYKMLKMRLVSQWKNLCRRLHLFGR